LVAQTAPHRLPPVELKALAGDWAAMSFLQEVQQTRSPHLAWFSEPLALSFSITPAGAGEKAAWWFI